MPSPIVDPVEHERRMAIWGRIEQLPGNPRDPDFHDMDRILDEFYAPTITIEELLERYARGEKDFVDISLPHKADLTGINLAGANLKGAKLNRSNLTGANLQGADLSYAWMASVNFTGANLEGANISWAYAISTNSRNASLKNAIGSFNMRYGATYENTIMPKGYIIEDLYFGER